MRSLVFSPLLCCWYRGHFSHACLRVCLSVAWRCLYEGGSCQCCDMLMLVSYLLAPNATFFDIFLSFVSCTWISRFESNVSYSTVASDFFAVTLRPSYIFGVCNSVRVSAFDASRGQSWYLSVGCEHVHSHFLVNVLYSGMIYSSPTCKVYPLPGEVYLNRGAHSPILCSTIHRSERTRWVYLLTL